MIQAELARQPLAVDGKVSSTVSESPSIPVPDLCVICLGLLRNARNGGRATALPCGHDDFDFPCLGTWLQQKQTCPLCKAQVTAVRHLEEDGKPELFYLPAENLPQRPQHRISRRRQRHRQTDHVAHRDLQKDPALALRKRIYSAGLYSLHVGANAISGYRNITPQTFASSPELIRKARIFIRRELKVFDFLNPDSTEHPMQGGQLDRRSTNAEFLLEYIIEILKVIQIKGSSGQAEELLKDYLGRANAKLFLHELESWLRSPCERIMEWDQMVQYASAARDCES